MGFGVYMKKPKPRVRKKDHPAYSLWVGIRARAGKIERYLDVTIAPEWDDFDNFKDWRDTQIGFNETDYSGRYFVLDKDIFSDPKQRMYSPETCCFVPHDINVQFRTKNGIDLNKTLHGISFNHFSETYQVSFNVDGKNVGYGNFYTLIDAFYFWKEMKQERLRYLADLYKDDIDEKVYQVLYEFDPDYPLCKEEGSKPIEISDHYGFYCGYDTTLLYQPDRIFFYEDGTSWRNRFDPWSRWEDV